MTQKRQDIWVDFGLSGLTRWFEGPWENKPIDVVAEVADWSGGLYLPTLWQDTQRLLNSPLASEEIAALWLAATGLNYDINRVRVDARDWLQQIREVCLGRLGQTPGLDPVVGWELSEIVLDEIRQSGPALIAADQVNPYGSVPGVVPALQHLTSETDPDLGFRLFLRALKALWIPITSGQLARYEEIGNRFGYNEAVVYDGEFTFVSVEG
ncbi:hypothetical protein DWB77_00366 [Streptomyces hundungensis]|uniref:Uncharacterized protein n=1 Tax=Streptomyces hundungensis TaxID=1077946 RepID=A0A387H4X4_9ACTN|nr:hypothetical protein [Streptomyces hundungensis]AYG78259.1 hypothetical protein DWB77_00366 [Streptomyces hundungensis]